MSWTCPCGAEVTKARAEHCPSCHQTFTNTAAGDQHRIGEHGSDRRCMTVAEMVAKRNRKGEVMFYRTELGYWCLEPPVRHPDRAKAQANRLEVAQ